MPLDWLKTKAKDLFYFLLKIKDMTYFHAEKENVYTIKKKNIK